jgi:hypothetical protein
MKNTLGFVAGGGRNLVAPYWYDPPPYDTYEWVWVPNPDVPSVDAAAIDAGSEGRRHRSRRFTSANLRGITSA